LFFCLEMSTVPTPPVIDYGVRASKPKTMYDFTSQVRDTHTTGVAMGAAGPVVLLTAFVSSTLVLMYRGVRGAAFWVERKVRGTRT
jgi:hypothetical protein